MGIPILVIVPIITSFVENYFVLKSIGVFFSEKSKNTYYLFVFIMSLISIFTDSFSESYILLVPILLISIYAAYNFYEKKGKVIFVSLVIFFVNIVLSFIEILLIDLFFNINIVEHKDSFIYITIVIFSKIILYIFCVALRNYNIRRRVNRHELLYVKSSIIYVVSSLLIFIILASLYTEKIFPANTLLLVLMVVIFVSFIFFVGIKEISKVRRINYQLMMENERLDYINVTYDELRDIYNVNNKNNHDFKNHLIYLQYKLKEKDFFSASQYINELLNNSEIAQNINCENKILNYILNFKNTIMIKKGITFYTNILNELYFLDGHSITTIFGNLLDNAIEAQQGLDIKKIELTIKNTKMGVLLSLSNTISKKIETNNGKIITTKTDEEQEHGFGIQNVKDIVESNNGFCEINCNDKVFVFNILFLINESEK